MDAFSLRGKIITKDNKPFDNLYVLALDKDNIINPNDLLGESLTNSNGFFSIDFDSSKFSNVFEPFEGLPDVVLEIKEGRGKRNLLTTKESRPWREIEYHIKLVDHKPDLTAPDIYARNAQRLLTMLNEVRDIIGMEQQINIDHLNNSDLIEEIRRRLQDFANRDDERRRNFEHVLVIFNSIIDSYFEEIRIGSIGYDGPQVPRHPRRESYNQEIIWPRRENFKWE